MRVTVIGSRELYIDNLEHYLPPDTSEIVSGGARGIDACAKEYAIQHGIHFTEFLPEYNKYGRSAPLKRNITIVENADIVIAFWDKISRGTKFVIDHCQKSGIPITVYALSSNNKDYILIDT